MSYFEFICISAPVSTALANRFTTKLVAVLGGIVFGLSRIISAFAPSLEVLVFSYGILGGVSPFQIAH